MSIRLRGITKVYRMGEERINALAGVDLEIKANEWVAIMGASGSGKSTLMNIIGCLDRPTSGVYVLDEQVVSRMGAVRLAEVRNQSIGFVFQSFELMPRLTALKNVELPLIYARHNFISRRKMAAAALERVGLKDRMHHRPNQLSGGQKQRVAIARAMVAKPSILLADEPTGNLDSRTTEEILDLFTQLHKEGQTIVMVTHEEDVAGFADRIVRMRDGKIISDLPTAEDRRSLGSMGVAKTKLSHDPLEHIDTSTTPPARTALAMPDDHEAATARAQSVESAAASPRPRGSEISRHVEPKGAAR